MRLLKAVGIVVCLVAGAAMWQGCAALLVGGAAAGATAGTVSYTSNEIRVRREVPLDRAWDAANNAMKDLQFAVNQTECRKDAVRGVLRGHNAQHQDVTIQVRREAENMTEIRVRVGFFDTKSNRTGAEVVYEKMKARL